LRLLTPLRLKRDGTYLHAFDLARVARDLSFRVAALGHHHGGLPWPAPWPEVMAEAAAARVEAARTRWAAAPRYSARQDRRIVLGGLLGDVLLAGAGASLERLLRAGAVLHAGKGTSLGLGHFAVEAAASGLGATPGEPLWTELRSDERADLTSP
jgi:hypothetical protein